MPNTPGDLARLYGSKQSTVSRKKAPKKSILKADSKYGPLVKTEQIASQGAASVKPQFKAVSAVKDQVVERETVPREGTGNGSERNGAESSTKKPVTQVLSRFRATRVHQ